MTPQEFFTRLAAAGFLTELRGVNATYRYDVEGAGRWRVIVSDGKVEVRSGSGAADCVVSCEAPVFVDIVVGKRNVVTALMQGRLTFDGPIEHLIVQTNLMRLEGIAEVGGTGTVRREARP